MSAGGGRNGDITEIQGISARKIGQDQGRHVKKIQNHNSLHSAEVFHKEGCSIYVKKNMAKVFLKKSFDDLFL